MDLLGLGDAPRIPAPQAPRLGVGPNGTTTVTNYNRAGVPNMSLVGSGATTTIQLPGREAEMALARESKELTDRQEQAKTALGDLGQAQRLVQLYERGLQTGGGEEVFQAGRQFFTALGLEFPKGPLSSEAQTVFAERVANRIKEFGVTPTDSDRTYVKQMVGSLNTDPTAMGNLMAFTSAKALKGLQDFQDFVRIKRENTRGDSRMYDTADVGVRMPTELFGTPQFQMSIVQALKQGGGDITRLNDPVSRKPFDAGTVFDLGGGAIPQRTGPGAKPAPVKPADMSDAQWKRLQELEKKYGGSR
jgi:hypothetical protein